MRYAQIRSMDISNGPGCRVSIFLQGCTLHCKNCFNSELWNFNGGKEFTEETKELLFNLLNKPYISGISILGGEPTDSAEDLIKLCNDIKESFPDKTIWLYSGRTIDQIKKLNSQILNNIDVLVDGPFIEELKNPSLSFRGSENQRIYQISKMETKEFIIEDITFRF